MATSISPDRDRISQWLALLPGWLDPRTWAYAVPGSRDYRIDLLRGFFVFAMVVDHIGGDSLFTIISGNDQLMVSAAEGFVFISGLLIGIVYGSRVRRFGLATGIRAVLKRAWVLYSWTVTLTLAFVGLFLFTKFPLWFDRDGGLGVDTPAKALIGALTLHYSYNGTDILLIYVLFVAAAPLVFYGLSRGKTALVLGASWTLWLLFQVAPEQVEIPWKNPTFFAVTAWQALFFTGLVAGYHRQKLVTLSRWLQNPLVAVVLAGLVYLSAPIARAYFANAVGSLGIPGLDQATYGYLFDKVALGPGRLVAFLAFAGLAKAIVTGFWRPLRAVFGWFLIPLGQNSLLAYGAHLFLIGPVRQYLGEPLYGASSTLLSVTLAQAVPLLGLWALVNLWPMAKVGIARVSSAVGGRLASDTGDAVTVAVRTRS